jgi:putative Ca2+/H+ antiporter (TMEM165/GDT1 family)
MDWKLFFITFFSIFLAELGDKTQLATMGFASQNSSAKWIIFTASASALVLSSFLGVIAGNFLSNIISPKYVKLGSAILFIIIGLFLLYDSISKS